MEKFTDDQILEFYEKIGLEKKHFFRGEEIINLYEILGIEPKFDDNGNREITPYEILGVPPVFRNGREVPIVFMIKNRTKKIGKYDGENKEFQYEAKRVKKEESTIETLSRNFKRCVFDGNDEKANELLLIIQSISDSAYRDLVSHFFNYSKYYKRMKKQLLIDLFAHFFLNYIRAKIELMEVVEQIKTQEIKPFKVKEDLEKYVLENKEKISKLMNLTKKIKNFGMKKVEVNSADGLAIAKLDVNQTLSKVENFDIPSASTKIQEIKTGGMNFDNLNKQIKVQTNKIKSKIFGLFDKIVSGHQNLKSLVNKKKKLSIFHPLQNQLEEANLKEQERIANEEKSYNGDSDEIEKINENSTF